MFVIGFPNSGRRSLIHALATEANASRVSMVPLRAAQLQLITNNNNDNSTKDQNSVKGSENDCTMKFALPNAKPITLIQLP